MKRILYDVPLWHLMLHREHQGLPRANTRDDRHLLIADELFEVLYTGEAAPVAKEDLNAALAPWAERVHATCRSLPHFQRLADDCRGDAAAAAVAVERLLDEVALPDGNDLPPGVAPGSGKDPLRRPLQRACGVASAEVQAYREAADGLAGVSFPASGPGGTSGPRTDLARLPPLLERLRGSEALRRIAALAGRFKRMAAAKRRQRVRHGADELADVEQGADLGRLLPSELVRLRLPALRRDFLRALLERQALQYQLVGSETRTEGPIVVLLDKSTSMDRHCRAEWAAAVTIALLDHAAQERRPFALLTFGGGVLGETRVPPGGKLPWDALTVPSEDATDISSAVGRGLDLVAAGPPPYRRSDLILITDGGSDVAEAPALRDRARHLGVTVFGVAVGMPAEILAPWCDVTASTSTLETMEGRIVEGLFAA